MKVFLNELKVISNPKELLKLLLKGHIMVSLSIEEDQQITGQVGDQYGGFDYILFNKKKKINVFPTRYAIDHISQYVPKNKQHKWHLKSENEKTYHTLTLIDYKEPPF